MNSQERISQIIKEYDGQGWHRTGTEVDTASGAWLREHLEAAGARSSLESYPFTRLDVQECSVTIEGTTLRALPVFDAGSTPPEGTAGKLGLPGTAADICVVSTPPAGPAPEFDDLRESGRYKAILSITTGGQPGLAPRNAECYGEPYGPPVLQVSSEHAAVIQRLAEAGAQARVIARMQSTDVNATNVVGKVFGTSPELPPIVVMTPRSGWWQCASERGGGIACWIEIARGVAALQLPRTTIFLASTGHELGYWGLAQFVAQRNALPADAALWLHLGASIGAALNPRPHLFCSSDELESTALDSLAKAGAPAVAPAPRTARPGGESRNIYDLGGRYISLLGGSDVFHLEADRWPQAIDPDAIAAYAVACISMLRSVALA